MICVICKHEIENVAPIILTYNLPSVLRIHGDEILVSEDKRWGQLHAHPECWDEALGHGAKWMSLGLEWK